MTRRALVWLAVVAALVAFAVPEANAHHPAAGPNAVTDWNRIATSTLVQIPGPASGAPPALQINLGMTQGAVYDAVNAITPTRHRHRPYLLKKRFSEGASGEAAVATAAYRVLSDIVSTVPASISFPNREALLLSLATQYDTSLAAIPNSKSKKRGIGAGNAAADAMIAARQDDGRFGASQWAPNSAAGHWHPLLPNGTSPLDPTPWVGGVKPFLLQSSSQFRTSGPDDLTSDAYAADFNEVKALGGDGVVTVSTRTADQTHNAVFWQSAGGPALLWSGVARSLAEDPARGLDLADSARLFAMMNLSAADAAINCWNDKYHFDFWRPWQAIRQADLDGNAATVADPNWTPLLTAPYPEYASGHLCLDGAHLRTLQLFFGTDVMHFGVTSSQFGGETRSFERFSDPLTEITEARIWAGLHFRTADVKGREMGIDVADYMAVNYFQRVRRSSHDS
ncbi:MAG: vanadium-dependent haloperoxidase [Ilumatobacteraceae bacterium]